MKEYAPLIIPGLVTIIVALLGVIGTTWASRGKNKADFQASLNAGYQGLVDNLSDTVNAHAKRIDEQQKTITAQGRVIQAHGQELGELRERVQQLLAFCRLNGLQPPDPPQPVQLRAVGAGPIPYPGGPFVVPPDED